MCSKIGERGRDVRGRVPLLCRQAFSERPQLEKGSRGSHDGRRLEAVVGPRDAVSQPESRCSGTV